MISQKHKGWRNPWVFGLLAIILAGVMINARFLWNAVNHPMRLLDDDYNVRAHNQFDAKWVQEQAERSTLGWQAKLHSPQQLQNDSMATPDMARFVLLASPADLKLGLNDQDGQPVRGLKVDIDAQWPGDSTFDFKGALFEATPGHYEGSLKFPRPGNWDLLIKAELEDRRFDMEQKVFVAVPKQ